MPDFEIEQGIHDYIVTLYLQKALDWDRKQTGLFKLDRFWEELAGQLARYAEAEHARIRKRLRSTGCRILLEEMSADRNVHVMYRHKGYEHHCVIMPSVLKGKCETRLKDFLLTR
ncbi:hypothetical protein MJA45_11290 [Paenibacillus aurantius]|uniref:Uncharacterized protein n=1 Tax=Paenibacillus aurantius TaxID=2918900 RepID=A0AA96LK45_9BACL|nr:hypothetical protein [Paenibacillus aurantius]WNQ13565.1 hypothetical protein MJA45_11290 [Paenibacillus aurantius]